MRYNNIFQYIQELAEAKKSPLSRANAEKVLSQKSFCKICGEPQYGIFELEDAVNADTRFYVFARDCVCEREEQRKRTEENNHELEKKKMTYIANSGLPLRFRGLRFENLERGHNTDFDIAFKYCMEYCKHIRQALAEGLGVYLYGPAGTGKTSLTACMIAYFAKQSIENENASFSSEDHLHISVKITSIAEIARQIKATWKAKADDTEDSILKSYYNVSVLFLDDFGTERMSAGSDITWMQELTYAIIDRRYAEKRPIIFTSNYGLTQLREEVGIMDKTVDRINEMSDGILQISGISYRKTIAEKRSKLF